MGNTKVVYLHTWGKQWDLRWRISAVEEGNDPCISASNLNKSVEPRKERIFLACRLAAPEVKVLVFFSYGSAKCSNLKSLQSWRKRLAFSFWLSATLIKFNIIKFLIEMLWLPLLVPITTKHLECQTDIPFKSPYCTVSWRAPTSMYLFDVVDHQNPHPKGIIVMNSQVASPPSRLRCHAW